MSAAIVISCNTMSDLMLQDRSRRSDKIPLQGTE